MPQVTIDTKRPAPRFWRKFENGYIMVLAPAIIAASQSWGLSDKYANRATIGVTVSMALVKFIGYLIANGEEYVKTTTDEGK